MNATSLPMEGLTLERLIQEAADRDVVFLTAKGETQFALMAADEGDQEVCALRSNPEFMAYLAEAKQRAMTQPRKSLQEIEALYGEMGKTDEESSSVGSEG